MRDELISKYVKEPVYALYEKYDKDQSAFYNTPQEKKKVEKELRVIKNTANNIARDIENEWDKSKYKINTKGTGIVQPSQCSQLPNELQQVLYQDMIFKYDPDLNVNNGFIRKGVVQNNGKYRFTESSFINSYIELIGYRGGSEKYIKEKIIEKLENNLTLFQQCSLIHKTFIIDLISNEDIKYLQKILEKENTLKIISDSDDEATEKIKNMIEKLLLIDINDNETIDFSFGSNQENYIFKLILSLKSYKSFLEESEEEKDDIYLIPVLSIVNEPINIIIFDMINDKIKIKINEYYSGDKYCFIYKNQQYYEPIIYRVQKVEEGEKKKIDMKIFSKKSFEEFGEDNPFKNKDDLFNYIKTPYPRGRMESF